jgi:hypothetical protein
MSKRKQPAVFVPPKLWTWWKIVGHYDHCLLPFRPTALEFFYCRAGVLGATIIEDRRIEAARVFLDKHGAEKVMRARGYKDMEARQYFGDVEVERIIKYATIRHLHPVTLPAVMDFTHFI